MANSSIEHQSSLLDAALLGLSLERGGEPLSVQLAGALRRLILDRRIVPGGRLPSSRLLARELSVSRSTVVEAIEQLVAEGYAEGRRGSGIYVAPDLPEAVLQSAAPRGPSQHPSRVPETEPILPFQPAAPDLRLFPHAEWAKLLERSWRDPAPRLLHRADPAGWFPLREAIARHLAAWRGIDVAPDCILILSGMAKSLDLIARALLPRHGEVLVEEPGYRQLGLALADAGLAIRPSSIDAQGLDIRTAARHHPAAIAAAITPSRHYPLGLTMPLSRRLELLEWARRSNALLIEDDYDSEYRYEGRPLPALMSLESGGRVIYLGSFSKVVASAVRLAFVAVPRPLAPALVAALGERGAKASLVPQPALAEFMHSGRFAAHIRRMRRIYAARQQALIAAARRHFAGLLEVRPAPAGMHLVAALAPELARRMSDEQAARLAAEAGITAPALSSFYAGPPAGQGLLLGYAAFDEHEIAAAAARLAAVLRDPAA